jgi:uncharacterized protein (TIGR02246 family)
LALYEATREGQAMSSTSTDEQAIRDLHEAWIVAVNTGDTDRLLCLMADDAVFMNPGEEPLRRDGFPAKFTSAHRRFHIRCLSELEEVAVLGDLAWTRCRDSLCVTPRDGDATTRLAGHRLTLYRRQPDGRWLLSRDANTLTPT